MVRSYFCLFLILCVCVWETQPVLLLSSLVSHKFTENSNNIVLAFEWYANPIWDRLRLLFLIFQLSLCHSGAVWLEFLPNLPESPSFLICKAGNVPATQSCYEYQSEWGNTFSILLDSQHVHKQKVLLIEPQENGAQRSWSSVADERKLGSPRVWEVQKLCRHRPKSSRNTTSPRGAQRSSEMLKDQWDLESGR